MEDLKVQAAERETLFGANKTEEDSISSSGTGDDQAPKIEHGLQTVNGRTILIKGQDSKWRIARQVHTQMKTVLKIKACLRYSQEQQLAVDSEDYVH